MNHIKQEAEQVNGPGWKQLQLSIKELSINYTTLCECLSLIVDIETLKITQNGRVEIPESSQRLVQKQVQFKEKLLKRLRTYERHELMCNDTQPEYVVLYKKLTSEINDSVDKLLAEISKQLVLKTEEERLLMRENKRLVQSNQDLDQQLTTEKIRTHKVQSELNVAKSRCQTLETMLNEKSKRIADLRRQSTVVLWQREKQKVLDGIAMRESELSRDVDNITDKLDSTKNRLSMRIDELKYQNSILKMRQTSSKNSVPRVEAEQLKRNLFIKERALIIAESELKKQQDYYAGLINGLSRDFEIIMSKDNRTKERYELHHRDYVSKMSRIKSAIEDGSVKVLRTSLPFQYHGVSIRIKEMPIKPNKCNEEKEFFVGAAETDVDLNEIPANKNVLKWRLGENIVSPPMKSLLEDIKNHHPSLVMKNGSLQINEAKTFFPYFSEPIIRKYFSIFKTLDENGDLSLDTTEILRHMPSYFGRLATTEEVADVIQEIDIDNSGTIDFFEFLLLIRLLEEGVGEAKLLRQESEKHKQNISENTKDIDSKVCSIM